MPAPPLDFRFQKIKEIPVKTILCLIAMMFCMARVDAAYLRLEGDLKWDVTMPQCTFKLDGELQNLSSVGTGPLKLVLWVTSTPFPSPGQIVGDFLLGSLPGNSQFTDFTVETKARLPFSTGSFYFTIAVVEYTTAGWRNVLLVPTGTRLLRNGNFVDQVRWTIPKAPVVAPPAVIGRGDLITLTERATGDFNRFPVIWQDRIKLDFWSSSKLSYSLRSRKVDVFYIYSVVRTTLKGKKVKTGKLVLTDDADLDDISFKNTIHLYFQGPDYGTYKSTVTGTLWTGTLGSSVTWGTFKLQ